MVLGPSRTMLHDALNGQTANGVHGFGQGPYNIAHGPPGSWVMHETIYACALLIIDGLGHATWSSSTSGFSIPNGIFLVKFSHYFSSACCAGAVGIPHVPV